MWICQYCNEQNEDEVLRCHLCGEERDTADSYTKEESEQRTVDDVPIPNTGKMFLWSIITCLVCLIPGIMGIIYTDKAAKATTLLEQEEAFKKARGWNWAGTVIAALFLFIGIIEGANNPQTASAQDVSASAAAAYMPSSTATITRSIITTADVDTASTNDIKRYSDYVAGQRIYVADVSQVDTEIVVEWADQAVEFEDSISFPLLLKGTITDCVKIAFAYSGELEGIDPDTVVSSWQTAVRLVDSDGNAITDTEFENEGDYYEIKIELDRPVSLASLITAPDATVLDWESATYNVRILRLHFSTEAARDAYIDSLSV